jgi:putative peptidoglycan lipid II flippase
MRVAGVSALAGLLGWVVLIVTDDLLGSSMAGSLARVVVGTVVIGGAALVGLVVTRVPELREPLAAIKARMGRG